MDERTEDQGPEGNPGGDDGSRTLQAWLAGITIGCVALAAMIVAFIIGQNNADETVVTDPAATPPAKQAAQAPAGPGMDLFVASCGSCHALSEAGTTATVGPNLDDLKPDSALVLTAIEQGGAGSGAMPAGLASGEEAQQIADYVADVAGSGN